MTDETNTDIKYTPIPDTVSATLSPSENAAREDAPIDAFPTEPAALKSADTFQPSRAGMQSALVGVIFLVIGFIGGIILMNSRAGMSDAEIEALVRNVVAQQVAATGGGGGGAINSVTLIDDDPSFGPDDAVVTIVEFSDFFCTYCTRFATETLPRLQERYGDKIRFVYRDMPIIAGQASIDAAIAGNCAFDQGKFWEFHNLLFANNGARARENFIAFADEIGLDTDQFEVCLDDPIHMDEITLDVIDGQTVGVTATPKFFVNGKIISGAQAFETFALVIDTELEKAGVTPPEAEQPAPADPADS